MFFWVASTVEGKRLHCRCLLLSLSRRWSLVSLVVWKLTHSPAGKHDPPFAPRPMPSCSPDNPQPVSDLLHGIPSPLFSGILVRFYAGDFAFVCASSIMPPSQAPQPTCYWTFKPVGELDYMPTWSFTHPMYTRNWRVGEKLLLSQLDRIHLLCSFYWFDTIFAIRVRCMHRILSDE